MRYKFRAESVVDVDEFRNIFIKHITSITYIPDKNGFPDVTVKLTTSKSLVEIRKEMDKIPDSHVMIESLNIACNYTGERWYKS